MNNSESTPLSPELQSLVEQNPVPLLRKMALLDPDAMKRQITYRKEGERSFFISMIRTYNNTSIQKDIMQFCIEYGYSPTLGTMTQDNIWTDKKNENKKIIPDYLASWNSLCDRDVCALTQICGKAYIKELDNLGFPLLKIAYEKNWQQTINLLDDFGIEEKNVPNQRTLLQIAQNNKSLLDFYWTLKKKKNIEADPYQSKKEFLQNAVDKIKGAQLSYENYLIEDVKKFLTAELLNQTPEHQEDMIAQTVMSANTKSFNFAVKLLGKNSKTYSPQVYDAWVCLGQTKTQEFLYYFLEKNTPLDSYNAKTDTYYLEEVSKYLSSIKYTHQTYKNVGRGTDEMKKEKIFQKLSAIMDTDFLLTNNPHDNNSPWFSTACKSPLFMTILGRNWMSIEPEKMTTYGAVNKDIHAHYDKNFTTTLGVWEKKSSSIVKDGRLENNSKIFEEIMNKTWFYKNEDGKYNFELAFETMEKYNKSHADYQKKSFFYGKLSEDFTNFFELDKHINVIPLDAKIKLCHHAFEQYNDLKNVEWFTPLFENLEMDSKMNWSKFEISDKGIEQLKAFNPELLIKLNHRKLEAMLQNDNVDKKPKSKI